MIATEKSSINRDGFENSVDQTTERVARHAHEVVDKAVDAARPTVDRVAETVHETVDKVAGAATNAAKNIDATREKLTNAQADAAEHCRTYVRDNPFASLGIAAVAGFILSRLLGSR